MVLRHHGYSISAIKQRYLEEHIHVSTTAIYSLLRKNEMYTSPADRSRRRIPKKLDKEKLCFIDEALATNDELTARQLCVMLQEFRV